MEYRRKNVKLLPLCNSDNFALVDDDVYEIVKHRQWRIGVKGYVMSGKDRLHRVVLGLSGRGNQGDHREGDKLDNRRESLRIATHAQNLWNAGKKSHNKSGFKGVYFEAWTGRFRAEIRVNKKRITLGRFHSAEKAAMAYDEAAREHHGEFARVNFEI
jgi:hypothetical protein